MGNHQTTPNNFHFINYGLNTNTTLNCILIDHLKNTLTEIHLVDSAFTYRAYYEETPFNLPQFNLECFDSLGKYYLTAPAGFNSYLWSNNETSQIIEITSSGDYQAYVEYGHGMLASFPFTVSDINTPCLSNSVSAPTDQKNSEIIGLFDLRGRQIETPVPNQIYIIRYADGHIKKQIMIE